MVKVSVEDINDNAPVFEPAEYNVTVKAGAGPGPLLLLRATDPDSGLGGLVQYSLQPGPGATHFALDQNSGELSLATPFSPRPALYRLEVGAQDGLGKPSLAPATVHIHVAGAGTAVPLFSLSRQQLSVSEAAAAGAVVGVVTPPRPAASLSLYPAEARRWFSLDARSGELRTRATLDHETRPEFLLNVAARGRAGLPGYTQLRVSVTDVNDNRPEFGPSLGVVAVEENRPAGTVVFASRARDADSGPAGRVTYQLVRDNKQMFSIDRDTGVLRTRTKLDYETDQSYSVTIIAADQGSPALSSTLTLRVMVQDSNDNAPQFEKELYEVELDESLPKDSQILALQAEDRDSGRHGRLRYSVLEADTLAGRYLALLPTTGILYLARALDREAVGRMELVVEARDHGSPPLAATTRVRLIVQDSNDNPPVWEQEQFVFKVGENLEPDLLVASLAATDRDTGRNKQITYNLKTATSSFRLDGPTGRKDWERAGNLVFIHFMAE